jgi:hypothetical protein
VILYWAIPYLLVAALPTIVVAAVLLGGCTTTRTTGDPVQKAQLYADPNRATGAQLRKELERREAIAELQRVIDESQR